MHVQCNTHTKWTPPPPWKLKDATYLSTISKENNLHSKHVVFFTFCLQKAEHKNTAQNLGRQYKVSPRPVPMPAIEADPALQESHGCPPATRTQSQHIAVNRRD